MAVFTVVPLSARAAGKPITASMINAAFENPEAIAEGAEDAPRIQLAALPELVAGSEIRARQDGIVSTTSSTFAIAASFFFLQRGGVRLTLEHDTSNASATSEVAIVRSRAGAETTLQTWSTTSTTPVARSVDVTVRPGDNLTFRQRTTNTFVSVSVRNLRIQTNGVDLWPGVGMPVEGNSV